MNGVVALTGDWSEVERECEYNPFPKNQEEYLELYCPARDRMRMALSVRLSPLALLMSIHPDRLMSSFSMLPRFTLPSDTKRLCFIAEQVRWR